MWEMTFTGMFYRDPRESTQANRRKGKDNLISYVT
jgi:hypothetical protein